MKSMFEYNSDGAGFAYVLDNRVFVEKGLMTYKDFERAYALFEKRLKTLNIDITDVPLMVHFRIGTHGPNSEGLTHPFPISHKFEHLSALDYNADIVMAHNGIINSVTPRSGWSDTQQYITDIVLPMAKSNRNFHKDPFMNELMANTNNGSRFAFLDKDGNFAYVGDWKEKDGIKYSNLNHDMPAYSTYGYGYGYRYRPAPKVSKRMVNVKPVPVGATLYKESDISYDYKPDKDAKGFLIKENYKDFYFVDVYGEIYTTNYKSGSITPMYYYTTALDKHGDIIYCEEGEGQLLEVTEYNYGTA
jgi:hypothetical protein